GAEDTGAAGRRARSSTSEGRTAQPSRAREDARSAVSPAAKRPRRGEGGRHGPSPLGKSPGRRGRESVGPERGGPRAWRGSGTSHRLQRRSAQGAQELAPVKPHEILLHPYVTEKTLNMLQGTAAQDLKDGNRLEFLVRRQATRSEIGRASCRTR